MSNEHSVTAWIRGIKNADEAAAAAIWHRYFDRLVVVAHKCLGNSSRRVLDGEDIAAIAMENVCRGAREGKFRQLEDREDLWQVLVMVTKRRAANESKRERAAKRGGGRVRGESVFQAPDGDGCLGIDEVVSGEPTPEFADLISRAFGERLAALDDDLREIAINRFEGYTNKEIADKLECSERTVERKLDVIRAMWEEEVE